MSHFAGASGTAFGVSATSGTGHHGFGTPTTTQAQRTTPPHQQAGGTAPRPATQDVVGWLSTPEARLYEGRWVLLDDGMHPVDSDSSPSELLARHTGNPSPTVVFVDPRGVNLAV